MEVTSVQTPEIIKGKFTKDFGEGFYCTELKTIVSYKIIICKYFYAAL